MKRVRSDSRSAGRIALCSFVVLVMLGSVCLAEGTVVAPRMTLGGGYSAQGRFVVSDSLTQSTGVDVQKGGRFVVTNVKGEVWQSVTAAKNWESYR